MRTCTARTFRLRRRAIAVVTSAGPTVSTPATGPKSQRVVSTPLLDGSTSRVLTELELLHFDALAQFKLAPQSLTSWLQRLGPLLDAQLLPEGTDRTVLVQTLFHKDRPAEFDRRQPPAS